MDTVTLTHPSGKFSVTVATARATTLRSRGYSTPTEPIASAPKPTPLRTPKAKAAELRSTQ